MLAPFTKCWYLLEANHVVTEESATTRADLAEKDLATQKKEMVYLKGLLDAKPDSGPRASGEEAAAGRNALEEASGNAALQLTSALRCGARSQISRNVVQIRF